MQLALKTLEDANARAIKESMAIARLTTTAALQEEAKISGLTCKDVARDGNCFFHAVADQLNCRGIRSDLNHLTLREMAVNNIFENWEFYKKSVAGDPHKFFTEISKPGEWANHQLIQALSNELGVTFVTLRSDRQAPEVIMNPTNLDAQIIYVGYEYGLHYQSILGEPPPDSRAVTAIQAERAKLIADTAAVTATLPTMRY